MAEVLSIVTGILQLLDAALKVKELVKDVYKATQEKQEILDDLEVLKPLLAELRLRILASTSQRVLQGMTPSLIKFHTTLEELTRRLQPGKDTFERLTWGFSEKKKTKEDLLALRQFHEVVNSWMILDFWDQIDAAQRLTIIEWLSPLNFFIRQQDISRTRQPETGEWLLKDPKFKEWELATGAVLWCSGIPGAGKTVLASLVVDHLTAVQAKNPDIGIACIYFNHKETQVQTLENLLAALWRQLVFKQPLGLASELHTQLVEKRTNPTSTEIQKMLIYTLQRFKQIYIIIDGVDEHPENGWHSLAGILTNLSKINLLVTARPHIVPNLVSAQMAILEIRASTEDLEVYVKAQIEASKRLTGDMAINEEVKSKICSVLCSSVGGMFLLAKLHLEALNAVPNMKGLHHALQTLPRDLDHTYDNIMHHIKCLRDTEQEIAQSALVWVANARRTLTALELCEAIGIEPGVTKRNKDNITGIKVIIPLCMGLIILDEQSSLVRLVHFTAQDYLDKVQSQKLPSAHFQIARSLFTYLNFKEVAEIGLESLMQSKQLKDLKSQHALIDYCRYCLTHAQLCEEKLKYEAIKSCVCHVGRLTIGWDCYPWNYCLQPGSPCCLRNAVAETLKAAACDGHERIVQLLLESGAEVNVQGGYYGTALQAAAINGSENIMQMLLDRGAEANIEGGEYGSALQAAAYWGHETTVQMLLDKGAAVNSEGGEYGTALQAAAYWGHENTVRMLLKRGAEVNIEGGEYGTALHAAAYSGCENIVQMLLNIGADVNAQGGEYGTALQAAAYWGCETIVQLLFDRGVEIDIKGGEYGTALHAAAHKGHETVVQMLLDKGAEVNIEGGKYGTALQSAAYGGHETIVQILLDQGAEINVNSGIFGTALQAAACEGHNTLVQRLLDQGADIDAVGGYFKTALQAAQQCEHKIAKHILLDRGAKEYIEDGSKGIVD
ncbi:ankyrin [Favolaschia claudopus]|uniref:Ankyrin n=1 Tax=Favolaschia claudopus TaxID=2862362 RepID=A0AAW0C312_9AGAR